MPLEPDRAQAERFVAALTGSADASLTFQSFNDAKDVPCFLAPLVVHGTLAACWDELVRANAVGHGVFFMVNQGDGQGRRAENVRAPRAVFVDDDSGELTPAAFNLTPSVVVQSRGGIHSYWRLRPGEPLGAFTAAQEALATALATDPSVKDLPRVMRLPGFYHLKDRAHPFLVHVVQSADVSYTIAEVLDGVGAKVKPPAAAAAQADWEEVQVCTSSDPLARATAWLAKRDHVAEGERNGFTYKTAAGLRDFGIRQEQTLALVRVWNHGNSPPLPDAELEEAVSNAFEYATGAPGTKPDRAATVVVRPVAPAIAAVRLTLDDIRMPPRETFAIGSMIPFAKSSVLYGPTSVGKSALAAQILFALAAGGESLWGLPLAPDGGAVLVYTAEDSRDDWKRKGAAVLQGGGIDVARALERFYIIDQSEGAARLSEVVTVRSGGPIESVSQRVARPTEEQDRLIEAARQVEARLVLVETASRLVEDEDNANFSALQSALGRIGRETRAGVLTTHHATKAASKENDSALESARGGGAFVYNARNALALFPATADEAAPYKDRFPAEDVFTLSHGKPTSSTKRQAPIVLVRCDAVWGAVFRLPDEVAFSPEQEARNAEKLEQERQREAEHLRRLYEAVEKALPTRPGPSPSWIRDNLRGAVGVTEKRLEALVGRAVEVGVLKVIERTHRGVRLGLGFDPRRPPESARVEEDAA